MKKITICIYGILAYITFSISFLFPIDFAGNLWVPKTIDTDPETDPTETPLIHIGL